MTVEGTWKSLLVSELEDRLVEQNGQTHVLTPDEGLVRSQLERVLHSRAFSGSQRNSRLLTYLVVRTLAGHAGTLKERTVGAEVFGRPPDYDTGADNVVRTAAGELRKRLAQYYSEPGHEHELRIELSPGSYIPQFRTPVDEPAPELAVAEAVPSKHYTRWLFVAAVAGLLLATLLWRSWEPRTAQERFWAPLVNASGPVVVCVGQLSENLHATGDLPLAFSTRFNPAGGPPHLSFQFMLQHSASVDDVSSAFRLTAFLGREGKQLTARGMETTELADLREHPAVFVGDSFHDWVGRILDGVRFYVDKDGSRMLIRDRQQPSRTDGAFGPRPDGPQQMDWGIVVRVADLGTGRAIVLVTGLWTTGTAVAADFLADPSYLEAATRNAPKGWDRKNIEIVVQTKVMNAQQGVPIPVAADYW